MKAIWNETVIAESQDTVVVEGNHYFRQSLSMPIILNPAAQLRFVPGKGRRTISRLLSMVNLIQMQHGTTRIRNPRRRRSEIGSHFGTGSKSYRSVKM